MRIGLHWRRDLTADGKATLEFWQSKRREMLLDPNKVQLNNGSFGPLPRPVANRLAELEAMLAAGPSDFYWRQLPPRIDRARAELAKFVNADPANLLLTLNATVGVNLAAAALELPPGSEILLTDQEYGACRYCWTEYASRNGWKIRAVPIPLVPEHPDEIVVAIEKAIRSETRVLFFSHVASPTGLVLPVSKLCDLARDRGVISVVDGAHAPAMVSVDLQAIGADFYAGNCHKWLLAPSGSAFLHVRPERKGTMRPLVISWGWDYPRDRPEADSGWGGSYWHRYLEFQGTVDRCPQMTIPDAIDFRQSLGEANISARIDQLVRYLRNKMQANGFEPAVPASREMSGTMTAFFVPAVDTVKARDWIWHTHDIEAPFNTSAGKHYLRVSTAWFTMEEEIDRLADAMQTFHAALPSLQ